LYKMKASVSAANPNALSGVQLYPASVSKVVHFIRHGEAWSNVAGQKDHAQYANEKWFDASLSHNGWRQAEALGRHIRDSGIRPQLVVVSPLTRALQTAAAAFGTGVWEEGGASANGVQPPLMRAREDIEGLQVAHAAISAQGAPPFLAHELCREHLGVHPCDRRRAVSHYREQFPAVDFSLIETEEDSWWVPDVRESKEDIRARGARFLAWLAARPEGEIAVVSHSSFLHFTLSNAVQAAAVHSEPVVAELTRWFENCELRTLVVADPGASAVHTRTTNFAGGTQALALAEAQGH